MKIEFNDNVTLALMAICLTFVLFQMGSCLSADNAAAREMEKAHIAAGECRDKWAIWSKCR